MYAADNSYSIHLCKIHKLMATKDNYKSLVMQLLVTKAEEQRYAVEIKQFKCIDMLEMTTFFMTIRMYRYVFLTNTSIKYHKTFKNLEVQL